nr:hypothetical protein [Tanacetum cinerariifolium]
VVSVAVACSGRCTLGESGLEVRSITDVVIGGITNVSCWIVLDTIDSASVSTVVFSFSALEDLHMDDDMALDEQVHSSDDEDIGNAHIPKVNTKFLNTLPSEWSKFVTNVKLVRDLHTTNIDQLHAYLGQHEYHANEVRLMNERTSDPLALISQHQLNRTPYQHHQPLYHQPQFQQQATSYHRHHMQQHITILTPRNEYAPIAYNPSELSSPETGLVVPVFQKGDDPIDAINHMMSFLTSVVASRYPATNNQLRTSSSSNPRQQATINNGRVTIQPIQGRQNYMSTGSSRPFVLDYCCSNESLVDKIIYDLNKAPDSPHLHTFSSNQRYCFHCKDVVGDDDDEDYTITIISNEPDKSLRIGDEHLDTIPATKSDEFIKSSVENLVPNPKSMLNHDSFIISSSLKIDSLLDEFAGELIFLKSILPGIDETDYDPKEEIRLVERLFVPLMKEIDLFLAFDGSIPLGIDSAYSDSEGDNLFSRKIASR